MSDLAEFLLARIAEDEATARATLSGEPEQQARWQPSHTPDGEYSVDAGGIDIDCWVPWVQEHVLRWDPARVLAECAAKRRIVEDVVGNDYISSPSVTDGLSARVLGLLALPYADHKDYDPAWRA